MKAVEERHIGDLEDVKTSFSLKLDNVKVHFDGTPPSHCFVKFYWDEASKEELTFHTDTIKEAAQHQVFTYSKEWTYTTKFPRTIGSHTLLCQVHGTVEKKKRVIGEARIDFGTIATGPTSYSLTLVTPDLVSVGAIEFDLKMLEIAPKVEVHLVIEVKTALQIAPEALRDGVVPIFELYAKRYAPQQQDKEQLKPLGYTKYKMPKREKGDHSPATTKYPLEALIISDQTIDSLEDVWVRVAFEAASDKAKAHPIHGGETVFPLKYVLSIDPTKPRTFTALVKRMAVNLVRYEVGTVEGRIHIENAPKFVQLIDAKFNGAKGLQGGHRYPGSLATTIKKVPTLVQERDHPAAFIVDNNNPILGDLQLDSIKPKVAKTGPQKSEPQPEVTAPIKKSESAKPPTTRDSVTTVTTISSAGVGSSSTGGGDAPARSYSTQVHIAQVTQTRVSVSSPTSPKTPTGTKVGAPTAATAPTTPKSSRSSKTGTSKNDSLELINVDVEFELLCGLCGKVVKESEIVLTHKTKNVCKACAKVLLEKKREMERAKADLQQNPPPKVTPGKSSQANIAKAQSEFRGRANSASADSIVKKPSSAKSNTKASKTPPPVRNSDANDYVDSLLAELESDAESKRSPEHKPRVSVSSKTNGAVSAPALKASKASRAKDSDSPRPLVAAVKESETRKRHSSYTEGTANRRAPRIADKEEDPTKGIQSLPLPETPTPTPMQSAAYAPVIHVPVPVPVPLFNPMMAYPMAPMGYASQPSTPIAYDYDTPHSEPQPIPTPLAVDKPASAQKTPETVGAESPRAESQVKVIPATQFVYHKPQPRSRHIAAADDAPKGTYASL